MPESRRPEVSVVVPLLDEAATLEELVARTRASLTARGLDFELVLVDDGSRDGTPALARRLENEEPRIRVFELTRNFGQLAALACGLFEARGEVVVTMDGDLQNPPEEIPKLLEALGKDADVATGRRARRSEGFGRRLGARGIHWIARWLTRVDIEDFGGQFKAYRRHVVEAMRGLWAPGKPIFPLALWLGFPVAEVTVRHDARRGGSSRYTLRSLLRINVDLVTSFSTLPLALLSIGGAASFALGLLGALACLLLDEASWVAVAVSLTLLAAGAQLLAAGILGQYLGRIYARVVGESPAYVVKRGPSGARRDEG